jgi:hypothetical protein
MTAYHDRLTSGHYKTGQKATSKADPPGTTTSPTTTKRAGKRRVKRT